MKKYPHFYAGFVFYVFSLFFSQCKDVDTPDFYPKDAEQIEGLWRGELHPHWFYHFSDGMLHTTVFDFQVNLVEHFYGYSTKQDTIFLRDMHGDSDRILTVMFENKNTATLTDVTFEIHPQYKINRFEY